MTLFFYSYTLTLSLNEFAFSIIFSFCLLTFRTCRLTLYPLFLWLAYVCVCMYVYGKQIKLAFVLHHLNVIKQHSDICTRMYKINIDLPTRPTTMTPLGGREFWDNMYRPLDSLITICCATRTIHMMTVYWSAGNVGIWQDRWRTRLEMCRFPDKRKMDPDSSALP